MFSEQNIKTCNKILTQSLLKKFIFNDIKQPVTEMKFKGLADSVQERNDPLSPGWDASPPQSYPQQYVTGTHVIHLGGERQVGVKFLFYGNNTIVGTGPQSTNLQI